MSGTSSPDPYADLEPGGRGASGRRPPYSRVGVPIALARGLRKQCPRCGARGLFVSWFALRTSCPRCELRFEKESGGFLGAMVLNYSLAIALWIVVLVVGLVLTVPDVPVMPLVVASVLVLIAVPLWFYPRSKTIWAAVEFLVARGDPDYREPVARDPRARELE